MRSDPDDLPHLLVVGGRPVAPLEVAAGRRSRGRGLLGRDHLRGAILLAPTRSVHTIGMRFALDVALCTPDLRVVAVCTLGPDRLALPRRGVRAIIEAEAGSFSRWGVVPGVQLSAHRR